MEHVFAEKSEIKTRGGVGVIYKESITILPSQQTNYTNFEHLVCSVRVDNRVLCYLSTAGCNQQWTFFPWIHWCFSTYLKHLVDTHGEILTVSDFNIHVDWSSHVANILETNDLKQHVNKSTYYSGNHILDLVYKWESSRFLLCVMIRITLLKIILLYTAR